MRNSTHSPQKTQHILTVTSESPEMTRELGRITARYLSPGDVISLSGNLGSGKTCFVQGVASALNLPDSVPVRSPSFTLINRYPTSIPIFHVDLYRLNSAEDVETIELDEILRENGLVMVEWPETVFDAIPWALEIGFVWTMESENERTLTFRTRLERFRNLFRELKHACSGH